MSTATPERQMISLANCKSWHVSRGYADPYCPRCAQRVTSGLVERFSTPEEIAEAKASWRANRGIVPRVITRRSVEEASRTSRIGTHSRWHTQRGLINPDCEFCVQ